MKIRYLLLPLIINICFANGLNTKEHIEFIIFKQDNSINNSFPYDVPAKYDNSKPLLYSYYLPIHFNYSTHILDNIFNIKLSDTDNSNDILNQSILQETNELYNIQTNNKCLLQQVDKKLTNTLNKIVNSKDKEVLMHIALEKLVDDANEQFYLNSRYLDNIHDLINPNYFTEGNISITNNSGYCDVELAFLVKEKSNNAENVKGSRRLKNKQLNYIDEGNYGILVYFEKGKFS